MSVSSVSTPEVPAKHQASVQECLVQTERNKEILAKASAATKPIPATIVAALKAAAAKAAPAPVVVPVAKPFPAPIARSVARVPKKRISPPIPQHISTTLFPPPKFK